MTDSSNTRVIRVINFLAAHPTESFTLSELATRLSLSYGSAHRVLNALTEARYLSRHPKHKTYSLGLALVAVGQATLEKHPAVDVARREMMRLSADLGVQCIASAIVDDEMLFIAREGVPRTLEAVTRVGERRPFMPPLGLGHVAWADANVVEAYLGKAPSGMSGAMRDYLLTAIEVVRERGYSMAAIGPGLMALRRIASDYIDDDRDDEYWLQMQRGMGELSRDEIQLLSLDQGAATRIGHISAPVFSPSGEVALELAITGVPDGLGRSELESCTERLLAAAATVTSETHGRMPRPPGTGYTDKEEP